ncbi:MAG: hypothetical protein CVU39_23950 [Chloroflexi bacterium HGW-Chloroflexi-10]|nr:MAG: hypothetical protein CVU39_23950 [Chloroflexi bacterium HGW-Chloroflexi-10]
MNTGQKSIRFLERCIEPSASVTDLEQRSKARLLKIIMLVFLMLSTVLLVFRLPAHGYFLDLEILGRLSILMMSSIGLFFAHRGHLQTPFLSLMIASDLIIFALAIFGPETLRLDALNYLMIITLFGTLFIPNKINAILYLFQLLGLLSFFRILPVSSYEKLIIGPVGLNITLGALILIIAKYRDYLAQQRKQILLLKEEQIKLSEEKFSKAFRFSPSMMALSNISDGRLIDVNEAFYAVLGYRREELLDHSFKNPGVFADPDDISRLSQKMEQDNYIHNHETQLVTKSGEIKSCLVSAERIEVGDQSCLLSVITDISGQKQIEAREREQRIIAEALRDTAAALSSSLEINDIMLTVLEYAARVVPHDAANIVLADDERLEMMARVYRSGNYQQGNKNSDSLQGIRIDDVPGFRMMSTTGQALIIADTETSDFWVSYPESQWVKSFLGMPIQIKGRTIGFLNLDSGTCGYFKQEHAERLQSFVNQVAVALENAHLYNQVKRLAIADELTHLYNRRGLFEFGKREVDRAYRFRKPLSALFVDIDHFREFNNKYSYLVGDQVLRLLAEVIHSSVRDTDLVGRYGGEEFVILLTETDTNTALEVAERLRLQVESSHLSTDWGELGFTVSIGVAIIKPTQKAKRSVTTKDKMSLEQFIEKAGQALQLAKQSGRNCVYLSED